MRSLLLLLPFFLLLSTALSQQAPPISVVPGELRRFQSATGGFFDSGNQQTPTAEATFEAVFLSSLFSLNQRIDARGALNFLLSLKRSDGGYASTQDATQSTLEATQAVVAALSLLAPGSADFDSVPDFLKATLNPSTGSASSRPGEPSSLKATLVWLELATFLGRTQDFEAQSVLASLKTFLSERDTVDDALIFFEDSKQDLSPATFNALCIRLGELVGYDFGKNIQKWADYFYSLQDGSSGCFSDGDQTSSVESTAHAVRSLYTLQRISQNSQNLLGKLDLRALQQCLTENAQLSVTAVAAAHRTLSLTNFFGHYFDTTPEYQLLPDGEYLGDRIIIQGQQIVPSLTIRTEFGPHPDMQAQAIVEVEGGKLALDLFLNTELFSYRANKSFDSSTALGAITITYAIQKNIPFLGALHFARRDTRHIGYGISVHPVARALEGNREIAPGTIVPVGTAFSFAAQLYTAAIPSITKGDFVLLMTAQDSSGIAFHRSSVDASTGEPLSFEYTLDRSDLPPGDLNFVFTIEEEDIEHSRHVVTYRIDAGLVASNLAIDTGSSQIGSQVTVHMEPVLVREDETRVPLASESAEKRQFFLDLKSPSGRVVSSLAGKVAKAAGRQRVDFSFTIPAELDFLGDELRLAFRYHPVSGSDIAIADDGAPTGFRVQSELVLASDSTLASSYSYGDSIEWVFQISDQISGSPILPPNGDSRSGVFLTHRHGTGSSSFVSTRTAVRLSPTGAPSRGSLTISPNAVSGPSTVSIEPQNADGNILPLTGPASWDLTVVGSLSSKFRTFSSSSVTVDDTAFLAEFSITHNQKPLTGAQLLAAVFYSGEIIPNLAQIPVGVTADGFTVSWTMPRETAKSGQYEVKILRQGEFRAQFERVQNAAEAAQKVTPLASIRLEHENPAQNSIFIPPYWFPIGFFGFLCYKVLTTYRNL